MGIELVANKYKKEEKDPDKIWANTELDAQRKTQCLCTNCDRKNEPQPYSSCPVAQQIYQICVQQNMAMAITRCGATDQKGNLLYKPIKK